MWALACQAFLYYYTILILLVYRLKPILQGAEEFVEFVGGVEVGFEVAGA
jgi:hypothetical protein